MQTNRNKYWGFALGIGITLAIAIAAKFIASLPFFSIMGQLVIAILIGIIVRALFGMPAQATAGITFSNKKLLRIGIILLGMRLNLMDIYNAGWRVFLLAALSIVFAFFIVYLLTKLFKVDKRLGVLTACGTAICGAAAIVAIAPQIKAKDNETTIGVATIAILGTLFTLVYTFLYPVLGLSPEAYGIFSGSTLHEIAHVIAAADPGGKSAVDLAVIIKLTRVALLIPVTILIGIWASRWERSETEHENRKKPSLVSIIPWFIFGFLAMAAINSLGIFSAAFANQVVLLAYMLMAMAMAGLGLNVDLGAFKRMGLSTFTAGLIGSVLLSIFGYVMIYVLQLA
ncbi:YeiH family putative sulfate export transporter [Paenibacillus albiflavus]|uniref:YeiH family putative sulfate export transporter n=1 Tax=Paenibacillus albiflavus TaxID=2545760 RepID=A0A4V2WPC5_9BACL|nr:YeiH family protein [Paenibacillus albiflavus]TCZ78832.1 YeiH family putative sulfate export transporter [Paenibacillus albiflavus]